jgi:hypothetical protein
MTPKPESETDPVRELCKLLDEAGATVQFGLRAQGHIPTIERMLADGRSWKSIGKEIGWDPLTAAEWYVRELVAARAAEAAQHQQERNKLVDIALQFAQANLELRARLAAVEAERDRLKAALSQAAQDLETVGNDYPGSSCWQWCAERAGVARAALSGEGTAKP